MFVRKSLSTEVLVRASVVFAASHDHQADCSSSGTLMVSSHLLMVYTDASVGQQARRLDSARGRHVLRQVQGGGGHFGRSCGRHGSGVQAGVRYQGRDEEELAIGRAAPAGKAAPSPAPPAFIWVMISAVSSDIDSTFGLDGSCVVMDCRFCYTLDQSCGLRWG